MATKIQVDPTLFPSIASFYEKERGDLLQVKTYVTSNCTLGDAFGLLLSGLKPQYESARDKAEEVMQTIANTLDKLSTQVEGYKADIEDNESSLQAQVDALTARLNAIQNPTNTPTVSGGGGGGYTGGGGGGSYSGPSGSVTPSPSVEPPAQDAPPTTINITAEPGSTVTVGNDDTVTTNPPATTPDPTATTPAATDPAVITPNPATGTPDPSTATPVPAVADPTAVAAENAREAAFYDQFWKEQASVDPLGRTADALREAWESKEPIQLDPTLSGGLGYGAPDPLVAVPFDFSLLSSTVPSTMAATSAVPVLTGVAQ